MAVPLSQDLVGMRLVQLHALAREFDWAESAAAELKETPVAEELRRMFTATWGNDVPGRPPVTAGPADLGSGSSWGKRPDWMRDGVRAALLVGYEDLEVVGECHYQDNLRRLRSPESQTEAFKYDVAYPAYGTPQSERTELDHLVPLELGGSNDATNLWPEYPPSPNPKDKVEDALNAAVCEGRVSLVAAQNAIASDWMTAEKKLGIGPVINPGGGSGGGGSKPLCTASASWSSEYSDYDVYVHSNQPGGTKATATASNGASDYWWIDSSGYADIYLYGAGSGDSLKITVGAATCYTAT